MKITNIEGLPNGFYEVTYTPNWLERFLGTKELKRKYREYGHHYIDEDGEICGVFSITANAIDQFQRKRHFKRYL